MGVEFIEGRGRDKRGEKVSGKGVGRRGGLHVKVRSSQQAQGKTG